MKIDHLGWIAALAALVYLAILPLTVESQSLMVISLLVILGGLSLYSRNLPERGVGQQSIRITIIMLAVFVTLRYFFWRTTTTIEYNDFGSFVAAIALYLAEVYGITIYFLGAFVNIFPLYRTSPPLPDEMEKLPTVDILIPSYNEDADLLEVTLLAATQVGYPKERLRVYLLDDGGTVQKRSDPDPHKAKAAWDRHHQLQSLCERVGATYLTRERNVHAKAGNVNAALKHCGGELVLILDADHVPARDILQKTVGFFVLDPKLFLVQTPHFFINPDPIERNLNTFQDMPGENEMFYTVVQHGLDFWGGSFFCGSAAVLRRSCLDEVGGISGETITEDAETALELHSRGYRSVYLGTPLISGLQPETFTGFVMQRVRWAQGMVQIFLLKNPLLIKGLTLPQRLAYTSSSFFWFFPFARATFLLAPAAFLLFGFQIYNANLSEFIAYALPHIAAATMLSNYLYGKTRWPFISELYETMQSLFSFIALTKVFRNPRAPTFQVTPKGEKLDGDFISSLAKPFYFIIAVTVVCLFAAVFRYIYYPNQADVALITGGWACFNLVLLTGALGALLERRQRRITPRIHVPVTLKGTLVIANHMVPCHVFDVSATGAGVVTKVPIDELPQEQSEVDFVVDNPGLGQLSRIPCRVSRVFNVATPSASGWRRWIGGGKWTRPTGMVQLGLEYLPASLIDERAVVALVFGDSEVLSRNLVRRQRHRSMFSAFGFLVARGARYSLMHFLHLFEILAISLRLRLRRLMSWAETF
ncbi:MAG: UDP-forming cellulose synthase catalytic subunit [Chromatiales bacterium]|nr:UDP-forming cellulose synthase catalytic subunit [Chromatiales bacterium]